MLKTILPFFVLLSGITMLCGLSAGDAVPADPVVATVNGVEIRQSNLVPLIDEFKKRMNKPIVSNEEKREILKGVVRRSLILQQEEAEKIKKEEKIVRQVEEYENQLVVMEYLERHLGSKLTVSEEECKEYYQKNLSRFSSPPKVKARHILLRSRAEAEVVMAELRKGRNFGELAKAYSIDLPRALEGEGGSMGVIEKGKTLPELERALFLLKEGEISEIVETRFGFHILTVDEIITTQFMPFEEVKDDIRKGLLQQKEIKGFEVMVTELEKNATIKIYEDQVVRLNRK